MCVNFDCCVQGVNNFQQAVISAANEVGSGIGHTWHVIASSVGNVLSDATKVVKDAEALRQTVFGAVSFFELSHALGGRGATQKALDKLESFSNLVSASRVFVSFDYFVSGKFIKDLEKDRGYGVVSEALFLVGRVGLAAMWAAQQNLVKLSNIAKAISSVPVLGFVAKVGLAPIVEVAFLLGLGALAVDKGCIIARGENLAYNIVDTVSIVADIAILSLGMFTVSPIVITAGLGIVAASTAVAAFLMEPKKAVA